MRYYLGIDPGGSSGGLAVVSFEGAPVVAGKMPDTLADLWAWVQSVVPTGTATMTALIEDVHAMPRQGVSSTFAFGRNVGALHMALTAARVPYETIRPPRWQRLMGCLSGGDKNVTKAAAQRLFPALKVTHAIADALLIAECARRLDRGILSAHTSTK